MAYVEVWKNGRLITRRRVEEPKARKGFRIRIGAAGDVHLVLGQAQTLGDFEVRLFSGEPPVTGGQAGATLLAGEMPLPPLSVGAGPFGADPTEEQPDIPGYRILGPLGRGGMGVVWRAEQLSTRRQVALKLLAAHRIESGRAQARFQREVELTARLDHPNITRLYDSGLHQGRYYYAMELIDGVPLDQYVKSKALSRPETLVLMQRVCQGVLFAHLHAVIHRDLKPSNILVGPDGQPHVLDFGLARGLLEDEEAPAISIEGQVAGTPAYMSPEQAAGNQDRIDTRTDVFSLGVILYELLTGQSPHDLSGSTLDVLRRVMEGRIQRPRELDKSIDGELEAILLTALATHPDERYASAGALAKDIGNYLEGEPLDTRAHTTLYFLRRKAGKYRVQIGMGLAVSLVLLGTVLAAYTRIVGERAVRRANEERIQRELEGVSEKLKLADLRARILGRDKKEAEEALNSLLEEYVQGQDEISQLQHQLGERKAPVPIRRVDLRPREALASTALVRRPLTPDGVESWTLETCGHRGPVGTLTYSPDGRRLASTSGDGVTRVWDAESGRLMQILMDPNGNRDPPRRAEGQEAGLSWSAGASTLGVAEIIRRWEVELPAGWQPLAGALTSAALSPDRKMLALGDRNGTIRVFDPASGRLRHANLPAWCGPVHAVQFSADGKTLATCAGWGTIGVCLWDAHTWQPLRRFEAEDTTGRFGHEFGTMAWGRNGTLLAVPNGHENSVRIVEAQSGRVLRVLYSRRQDILSASRVSDGAHEGLLKIGSVSWLPDSMLLAGGRRDGKVLVWDLGSDSSEPSVTLDAHTGTALVAWEQKGRRLITGGEDGGIKLWEPHRGTLTATLERPGRPITCLAPSPDGHALAAGNAAGTIRLWNVEENLVFNLLRSEPNDPQAEGASVTAVAWSPDGARLASGDADGTIRIWDPRSRQPRRSFAARCGTIASLTWSPDGRLLVCGGADGTGRVWDVRNDFEEYVVLLPLWGSAGPGVAISRGGDYRGPPGVAEHLLYIAATERGRETLTPANFQSRFGWVNEPWQVGLYTPGAEKVKRIYVKAEAQPPYDGNSWAAAFNDLQDALSVAQPDTEIWVAAGVYRPDRGTGARTASFRLKDGVRLYGGFAGTETSLDQRDPNHHETILSGDLQGDDGADFANYDDNSYHVILGSGTDETAVLNGFVVTSGNAEGPGESPLHKGGGICI